jgi:adenylate kinase family enzyme/8-oxo-dGTP pyrophosphatase MutT (NUDIX family)
MTISPILSTSPSAFPNFKIQTQIATIFLEHDKHILLLKRCPKEDQPHRWGIPGGKALEGEKPIQTVLRELQEETGIQLEKNEVIYHGHRYVRIPKWDYRIDIYQAKLKERPVVQIDPQEHSSYEWVSIYAFKLMSLIKVQDEIFDIVYGKHLWQKVETTNSVTQRIEKAALILRKGQKELSFNENRRLVLNLIGTSGSGKGTQGDMLSQIFGIPNVSAGDLFRDEFRSQSALGWIVDTYDKNRYPAYLPDEVPTGMMVQRLANDDCSSGYILDGFPRTAPQSNATRKVILKPNDLHIPIFMDVPEQDIRDRISGRSICPDCGHQVRKFDENLWPGYCPIEGAQGKKVKLEKRIEDIDLNKLDRRLKMFRDNKDGILNSLEQRDPVNAFSLNNKIPPKEVLHQLRTHIEACLDEQAVQEESSARMHSKMEKKYLIPCLLVCLIAGIWIGKGIKK